MSYYGCEGIKNLIGRKIERIFMNEDNLKFTTDKGNICFCVVGDCCSHSMFYDFFGVKKLLGATVKNVEEIELTAEDIKIVKNSFGSDHHDKKGEHEAIAVYGFRITTEDDKFGEVSSVFSFRNYSNGYYGGSLEDDADREVSPEIFDDVIETAEATNKA